MPADGLLLPGGLPAQEQDRDEFSQENADAQKAAEIGKRRAILIESYEANWKQERKCTRPVPGGQQLPESEQLIPEDEDPDDGINACEGRLGEQWGEQSKVPGHLHVPVGIEKQEVRNDAENGTYPKINRRCFYGI